MAITKIPIQLLDATGTASSSNYLRGDGAWNVPSSGFANMVLVTATGNWTVPAGITTAKVTLVAAGGAGGGTSTSTSVRGGAGKSGGAAVKYITGLTSGSTIACTIGAGGTGVSGGTGNSGGTTSFGAYCSATGGAGSGNLSNTAINTLATGGVGSSGDLNLTGPKTVDFPYTAGVTTNCVGTVSSAFISFGGQQGADGPLNLGYGGAAKNSSGAGNAATGYGAGGSGSFSTGSSIAGGAGSPGVIIIEY